MVSLGLQEIAYTTIMKNKTKSMLAFGLASITFPAAHGAGMLFDPGFEDTTSGNLDGDTGVTVGRWNPFSGGAPIYQTTTANPRSGAQNLRLTLEGVAGSFVGVAQDISVTEGEEVTYSLWHAAVNNDPNSIEIRIEWRDSVNNVEVARTGNSTPTVGPDYEFFSLTETVPAGADTARVVYAIQSFGGNATAQVDIDDVTFVPEPSSSLLAALALLGLAARRRR